MLMPLPFRFLVAGLALGCLAAAPARSAALDAPAVARFDVGYLRCEQQYPHMRGHRDEAYLALWRMQADEANRARLAKLRQSAPYRKEQQRFARASTGPAAAAASSPVRHQCQALWAEKTKADARKAAAAAKAPAAAASRP